MTSLQIACICFMISAALLLYAFYSTINMLCQIWAWVTLKQRTPEYSFWITLLCAWAGIGFALISALHFLK